MDIATLIGIVGSLGLILGAILVGGDIGGFIDIPSVIIVIGGTFAVGFTMFPLGTMIGAIKVFMKSIFAKPPNLQESIATLISLAETARKESLVALEKADVPNPYMKRGVLLVSDGTAENLVRDVMDFEISSLKKRHQAGQAVFKGMGDMAPAFGMIGTLVGLVQMLQNLDDPSSIGPSMAVALLTTMYGAIMSNCLLLPIVTKLEQRSAEETLHMELVMEGVISILNGEHPNIVKEKLDSFLPPAQRQG